MLAPWPTVEKLGYPDEVYDFVAAKRELITAGRALRAEYNIPPSKEIAYVICSGGLCASDGGGDAAATLKAALRASDITITDTPPAKAMPSAVCKLGTIYLTLEGLIDVAAEVAKINAEITKTQGFLNGVNAKLSNETFVSKAPANIIEQQRAQKTKLESDLTRLEKMLASFGG